MRFRQEVRFEHTWMPGDGPEELGIHDFHLHGTFAIPFLYNTETPLLVTPGFGLHLWNGPSSPTADMPPRTFDAYLDAAWNPQLSALLGGELGFTVGVHSDFSRVVNESIRYRGRGLLTLAFSPSFTVKAGVIYLDRVRVKILPAGGLIWVPAGNPDVRFEVLFPNPRLAIRLTTDSRNTEWWLYARGEYGGGSWTVRRAIDLDGDGVANDIDEVDYNDLRFAVGLEFDSYTGLDGLAEIGLAFERELFYRSSTPTFRPNPTVFVGGQLAF
ncbi:MAG TPA: hypothetical protein EYP56_18030 [Planctomycetaceae bacterium]|nr:hypothetical protein [Planctomycetaceae bacterium]